jgi:hypothetical protein
MAARLDKTVDEILARDLPGAARNLATSIGIHTDKAELFAARPMAQAVAECDSMLRELKDVGIEFAFDGSIQHDPGLTIEGTATEETIEPGGSTSE